MDQYLSGQRIRPNLPLRKPSSSPMAHTAATPAPTPLVACSAPGRLHSGCVGDGPVNVPVNVDKSPLLGSVPPSLNIYLCNFCAKQGPPGLQSCMFSMCSCSNTPGSNIMQNSGPGGPGGPTSVLDCTKSVSFLAGNFRCNRCRKIPYCSVVCQREDWKAHRHVCKPADLEPAKGELSKEATCSLVAGDGVTQMEQKKHGDAPSPQRVYLKDLPATEIDNGAEFQGSVVEFYTPGRFFVLAQSPEIFEALKNISSELQKTYSCPLAFHYVPCVGEVCAVRFSFDLNWYRGLVQTLTSDLKMASILYIDFGNEETVVMDKIRPLASTIQLFRPCAMECRVAGVVSVFENWSSECCSAVRQILASKTLTVKPVETQENGHIYAVDVLLSNGKQLSTFLIEHGYAQKEIVKTTPTEREISAMMSVSLENFRRLSDGKNDNTWAQPPEPLSQAVRDQFTVVVTHFQSPTNFIVQKVENAGMIQDLQLKLREHCNEVAAPQKFRPAHGTVCCAQFTEDKQWYRAKVLAYSSEERVCVGYLDFGNSEEVDLSNLRPISASLLTLPMQAMPCGLAGVQPVGESWSDDCLLALQRRVSNRILRIEIQGAQHGKALVSMIDEASDPQANVAELLVSAGYAAPAAVGNKSDQKADGTPPPAQPHSGSRPVCEPLVWHYTELPCDSQTVALQATFVNHPGDFHCRISNPTDLQQLKELEALLKQHCEADVSNFVPKVGEPCCAILPGDGKWCRVMVKEISEDNVAVNFVDSGCTTSVKKILLRSITPRMLTLPFQAVHCWLSGVEPLGSEWSSEARLCFQTLVDGEQLSGRVVSVTERGYGVELESKGQNVPAALISAQLAKVPGEMAKELHAETSPSQLQESVTENEYNQLHIQKSLQAQASFEELADKQKNAVSSEAPSFPVDWKAEELPLNETFQPYLAAVISPTLFYLLGPNRVDEQKLQEVMMQLAAYCNNSNNNQISSSSAVKNKPAPGAACSAQFSLDSKWYRAVVLEVGESEISVIYADHGNTETMPFSQILPIPAHLLQLPFLITRCTLAGQEHFPAEWPQEVTETFKSTVLNGVLATVQSFDGSANVLSLTSPTECSGGTVSAMILDALRTRTDTRPCPPLTQKDDKTTGSSTSACATAEPECSQLRSIPDIQRGLTDKPGPTQTSAQPTQDLQQKEDASAAAANEVAVKKIGEQMELPSQNAPKSNDPKSSCCCLSLETKIDHLEQMMQQQLALIKQLVGQTG